MNAFVEAVTSVAREEPPRSHARGSGGSSRRDDAGRRAGLTPDEVEWLEEGRLYRFRSSERATLALLLYATSLGIDRREARRLPGLPVAPVTANPRGRLAVAAGLVATALALLFAVALPPRLEDGASTSSAVGALPPPWRISVDVLNGGGGITYTRRVADRIGSFAYQIKRVTRAGRFDYPETSVSSRPAARRSAAGSPASST